MKNLVQGLIKLLQELEGSCDLFIFDFNGVLDNQDFVKRNLLAKYSNTRNENLISDIFVAIERNYENNKGQDFKRILFQAFEENDIRISDNEIDFFVKDYMAMNSLNQELVDCVGELSTRRKVALYTSLSSRELEFFPGLFHENLNRVKIFSRDQFKENKPSLRNIKEVCALLDVAPERTVLVGDNVVCDLMPAKLIGIKTVLYSRYVDYLVSE